MNAGFTPKMHTFTSKMGTFTPKMLMVTGNVPYFVP